MSGNPQSSFVRIEVHKVYVRLSNLERLAKSLGILITRPASPVPWDVRVHLTALGVYRQRLVRAIDYALLMEERREHLVKGKQKR